MATIRSYQSSNDNTIFLLDYIYYIVHEVGCRWFFDHYLLYFTHILLYIERWKFVISPEYYGTTQHSLESPNFVVLGGNENYCCKVTQLYSRVKNGAFSYIYVDWKTAELAKYMENCWIATKVTFCNEFADIAKAFGIQYEHLRQCFVADERVNPSHTYVYPEQPYYDSHCLNKDIPALLVSCKSNKIKTPLMDKVHMINLERKSK